MTLPKMFVGSAHESEDMIVAIRRNLSENIDVISWRDSFGSGEYVLQAFLKAAEINPFGLFIFSPADYTTGPTGDAGPSPRDNVVLEAGAFLGRYGQFHTMIMLPSDVEDFKKPTDLQGLILINYKHKSVVDAGKDDDKLKAALRNTCDEIRGQVNKVQMTADNRTASVATDGADNEQDVRQPSEAAASMIGGAVGGPSGWAFAVRGLTPIPHSRLYVGQQVIHGIHGMGQVVELPVAEKIGYALVSFASQLVLIPLQGRPQLFDLS